MGVRNRWETLLIYSCCPLCKLRRVIESLRKNKSHHRVDSGFAGMLTGFFFSFLEIVKFHRDLRAPCRQEDKKSEVLAYWIANKSLTNALHSLLLYPFSFSLFQSQEVFFLFFFYPSRHGMVSPPQIVRNKRLARVQKYNFISEKTNTNMVQRQKK